MPDFHDTAPVTSSSAADPEVATQRLADRPRSLAHGLVELLEAQFRSGQLAPETKLPTESALMRTYGVSRTVVREALSSLQASGWVKTRHGVGSFVQAQSLAPVFALNTQQRDALHEVIATLELRVAVESEAAALAAQRRTTKQLQALHAALVLLQDALAKGVDSAAQDYVFHLELSRATHNPRFVDLLATLGVNGIPRARLSAVDGPGEAQRAYLQRVQAEHESIYQAVADQDPEAARAAMRTHLVNSRERRRRALEQGTGEL